MEQHQIKASVSIARKLVVSLVVMVLFAVALLNGSAIYLIREDKKAYIFQNQASHIGLIGRELNSTIRHGLDTLRLAMGSFDPTQPPNTESKAILQTLIENQSDVMAIQCHLMQTSDFQLSALVDAEHPAFSQSGYALKDLAIPKATLEQLAPDLIKQSFALLNFSLPNRPPLIGVIFADLRHRDYSGGMPIAVGFLTMGEFALALSDLSVSVANATGWTIFDTDPSRLLTQQSMASDPLFRIAAQSKLESGAIEFEDTNGKFLGSFIKPGYGMIVLAREDWKMAMKATYALSEKYIILGLLVLGLAIIFAIFFAKSLTLPIRKLFNATQEMMRGNFSVKLRKSSNDEIGALTDSFAVMSKKIGELIQERMDKASMESEISIASTVQQTLFPEPNYEDEFMEISSYYLSASQCGGDWWGHFRHGNKMCIMIADATGHGIPSALMTATARSCFSVLEAMAKEDINLDFNPRHFLKYANYALYQGSRGKVMMTFFIGILDFETGTLSYANAGHNPPWLFHRTGEGLELRSLTAKGVRLGEEPDLVMEDFEEKQTEIGESDILFMYTDGVIEGKNTEGVQYGKKRVRQKVELELENGPNAIIHTLMDDFMSHNGKKELDDDVTLVVSRITQVGIVNE